ncbi:hypothetical protein T261_2954 [Streptomyces lydicus]|nr:hypothetical protein T261_2954 [Streptomyces lydicus]
MVVDQSAIRTAVQRKNNPAELINVALEEPVRGRCEPPGYTTLWCANRDLGVPGRRASPWPAVGRIFCGRRAA